jgi:hypothetical protein
VLGQIVLSLSCTLFLFAQCLMSLNPTALMPSPRTSVSPFSFVQAAHLDQFDRLLFLTGGTLGTLLVVGLLYAFASQLLAIPWGSAAQRVLLLQPCRRCRTTTVTRTPPSLPAGQAAASQQSQPSVIVFRAWVTKAALAVMFLVYPGVSTEIVKSFRWAHMCIRGCD